MVDVTFDGPNHLIIVNNGITVINVQDELYSDWKEWIQQSDNIKYYPAFDTPDGGRDLSPTKKNGDYYFLNNQDFPDGLGGTRDGWRIRPYEGDHELIIEGNLYVYDVTKAFTVPTLGDYTVIVRLETSSLTQTMISGSGVTEQDKEDIVDLMWNEPKIGHNGDLKTMADNLDNPDQYKADISGIPTDIWEEVLTEHSPANSAADLIKRSVGLMHHNHVIEFTWAGDDNTGAEVYLYDSKANAEIHDGITGLIGKYSMEGIFNNNKPEKITMVKTS